MACGLVSWTDVVEGGSYAVASGSGKKIVSDRRDRVMTGGKREELRRRVLSCLGCICHI